MQIKSRRVHLHFTSRGFPTFLCTTKVKSAAAGNFSRQRSPGKKGKEGPDVWLNPSAKKSFRLIFLRSAALWSHSEHTARTHRGEGRGVRLRAAGISTETTCAKWREGAAQLQNNCGRKNKIYKNQKLKCM